MSDILERLGNYGRGEQLGPLLRDSHNEIARLRAEVEQLRAALRDLVDQCQARYDGDGLSLHEADELMRARRALGDEAL